MAKGVFEPAIIFVLLLFSAGLSQDFSGDTYFQDPGFFWANYNLGVDLNNPNNMETGGFVVKTGYGCFGGRYTKGTNQLLLDHHAEFYEELALLYGLGFRYKAIHANILIGAGKVNGERRGTFRTISEGLPEYEELAYSAVGLAFQTQLITGILPFLGLGLGLDLNINRENTFFGFTFGVFLGKLTSGEK